MLGGSYHLPVIITSWNASLDKKNSPITAGPVVIPTLRGWGGAHEKRRERIRGWMDGWMDECAQFAVRSLQFAAMAARPPAAAAAAATAAAAGVSSNSNSKQQVASSKANRKQVETNIQA